MAKYNGPVCRFCRREGQKLFLKGERCYTDKCSYDRKNYAPGVHGQRRSKVSEYGTQLREKQKVRRVYGMVEKQFRNLFQKSAQRRGVTADLFFQSLELRLDNVIYRMGFARSRQEAKQVVGHNHVYVNGRRTNISSARLKVGDEVKLSDKARNFGRTMASGELFKVRPDLGWFEVDHEKGIGKITAEPTRDDIGLAVKERLIVELYSK